jgi:hypothetical protein
MLIRQDFYAQPSLPPRLFMEQIMDKVSKAYCFLWDKKDEHNKIDISWKELTKYYNKNAFRSNLRKLNNEGLLDYEESEDGISIEMVGWDEVNSCD